MTLPKSLRSAFAVVVAALLCSANPAAQPLNSGTPTADYKALWAAQPDLLKRALAALPARKGRSPRVYAVAVAAGGSQEIFGREAEAVRDLLVGELGRKASAVLLSNASAHQHKAPLANRDNLAATLIAIGERFDPKNDLAVIYITSHGSPRGEVQTDLPNRFGLKAIDAKFLAEALTKAGIERRIIVISACFGGSWIPALSSPDTIVLTAASATRSSFGCDDRRKYTFFGQALLEGSLDDGASWKAAFAQMQAAITAEEARMRYPSSFPTAAVGENMDRVWNRPRGVYSAR